MVLGKIISSGGYTFGQKWIISMIFRSFFITCIHKYGPNSPCASKMISIFMIFYYLYGIFWYCEVRSVGSLTLIKSRFGRGVSYLCMQIHIPCNFLGSPKSKFNILFLSDFFIILTSPSTLCTLAQIICK